ncbi:phytanoyl-CoA dioxygenase family protein [Coleofasciculus sp. FACHB-712]|uniref:phytanoyl-CoA dioxygenase family protein n=1 Tax=Coleofasciculus sp. FACHB-712 TaxID=2692789 RepID=UPI001684E536|nr:phytanoyl-CoA dioxygenase family protein [Coleofasciculus sp. FACHB-712]MBD1943796.1 phytanoyl-CoA dioxygenase family protein [Coleofasciculus sp. FACHB-712]
MMTKRYNHQQIESFAQAVLNDGYCVLPNHFSPVTLNSWREAFTPLLEDHIVREGKLRNRGSARYYVTLPFTDPFADPSIYEDDDILALVELLVGKDAVMCQLATDTPLLGSEYQDVHRDAPPLFPEMGTETPPFQLAVNFPLVDITLENGPMEITRSTHMISKEEGLRRMESGEAKLEPVTMQLGDVMIRDVRGLHRGTPNYTETPRPMVVIGYSRRWMFRPEVSINIPRATLDTLSERARHLLRFNPIVESVDDKSEVEVYQSFAY